MRRTKIRKIVSKLYNDGELTFGESLAIMGAIESIYQAILDDDEAGKNFVVEFGTMGGHGISSLMEEKDE